MHLARRSSEDRYLDDDKMIFDIINKAIYPTKQVDEFDYFCKALNSIAKTDENTYNSWVSIFNDNEKLLWQELIHTRRIQVSYKDMNINVPRRTVKLKRNEQNM